MFTLISSKNRRNHRKIAFKPGASDKRFELLDGRLLTAPVFSQDGGGYAITTTAGSNLPQTNNNNGSPGTNYADNDASEDFYIDPPTDIEEYVRYEESGQVTNNYNGPHPSDPTPGTLQEILIGVDHQNIDTIKAYDYDVDYGEVVNVSPFEVTTASSGGTIPLTIQDNNGGSLSGQNLAVTFTASISAVQADFYRTAMLDYRSTYLDVAIGADGLVATNSAGAAIYSDPGFGTTASSDDVNFHFSVALPNSTTTPMAVEYDSELRSGSGDPYGQGEVYEEHDVSAGSTLTQEPYFSWNVSYDV